MKNKLKNLAILLGFMPFGINAQDANLKINNHNDSLIKKEFICEVDFNGNGLPETILRIFGSEKGDLDSIKVMRYTYDSRNNEVAAEKEIKINFNQFFPTAHTNYEKHVSYDDEGRLNQKVEFSYKLEDDVLRKGDLLISSHKLNLFQKSKKTENHNYDELGRIQITQVIEEISDKNFFRIGETKKEIRKYDYIGEDSHPVRVWYDTKGDGFWDKVETYDLEGKVVSTQKLDKE